MQDMLVKLYDLPDDQELAIKMKEEGILIRRALACEKSIVVKWAEERFGDGWASEVEVCFSYQPITCFIAIKGEKILGYACYDSAYRNFFGPTGVDESERGKGIGKILLLKCLYGMREQGYAYGIIGGVGPAKYYEKVVNAELIEGSDPGIYKGILSYVPVD
jgi:GNAT superfamily N-acetyltransferase